MAKSMLKAKAIPKISWGEAVLTIVYILYKCPTNKIVIKTPHEA